MRSLRIVLTLVFGLAMVGPEAHACPIHDQAPAGAHHQHSSSNHQRAHCTCPQACCPAGVTVSMPATVSTWSAVPLPVIAVDVDADRATVLPSRKRFLPFALAPPRL
jgi:hypothetical protein